MVRRLSRQERLKLAAAAVAQPESVPAPIKGWNARDALTAMDPLDAVQMDNFYPDVSGVNLRNGFVSYATGLGNDAVSTLAEYNANGISRFFAGCGGFIWDISSGGNKQGGFSGGFSSGFAGGGAHGPFSFDAWQTEQFLSRLFFVNGVDTPQVFDGSVFSNTTFTGSGLAISSLIGIKQYQQRLFFWQANSTGFWYAPLNAITGTLVFYDLSPFSPAGGNLVNVTTYSHDGGNGVVDFIVFYMSSGWALIFFGNDPGDVNNWAQIGRYRLAPPVNIRACCSYGGEAYVTTYDDHVGMSAELEALKEGRQAPRSKVSTAVQQAVAANPSAFGWQALYYTKGRRLIFNIPNADGTFSQHVQNVAVHYPDPIAERVVGPWCRFVNMPANCWGLYKDNLFFGAPNGTVYQADIGALDNLGAVTAVAQQAWNDFKSPNRKRLSDARPIVQSFGNLTYTFAVGFDYGNLNVSDIVSTSAQGSPWDVSPWDTSPWSPEFQVSTLWRGAGGDGVAAGWSINVAATNSVTWLRTDLRGEIGNAL